MATITWRGGSGDWASALAWEGFVAPGSTDDALVGANAGTITLDSAESIGNVALEGGVLEVLSTLSVGGTLNVAGGTLVLLGTLDGGTLSGVTQDDVGHGGALLGVTVVGGLDELTGVFTVDPATVSLSGAGSIDPDVTLGLTGGTFDNANFAVLDGALATAAGKTATFGPHTTIDVTNESFDDAATDGTLVNQGLITVPTSTGGGSLDIGGASFVNQGAMDFPFESGTIVAQVPGLTSFGQVVYQTLTYDAGTPTNLTISSATFDNAGALSVSGGDWTDSGTVFRNEGAITLAQDTAEVVVGSAPNAYVEPFTYITNIQLDLSPVGMFSNSGTITGSEEWIYDNSFDQGSFTNSGLLSLSGVGFSGTSTAGAGVFDNSGTILGLLDFYETPSVFINSGSLAGGFTLESSGQAVSSIGQFANSGNISEGDLAFTTVDTFSNTSPGVISVSSLSFAALSNFSNTGTITAAVLDVTDALTSFVNTGSIAAQTLILGGSQDAADSAGLLGAASGGTLVLAGTYDLQGGTLDAANFATVEIDDTIENGVIAGVGTLALNGATLQNVSIDAAGLTVQPTGPITLIDPPADTTTIGLDTETTDLGFTATATLAATAISAHNDGTTLDTIALGAGTLALGAASSLTLVSGSLLVNGTGALENDGTLTVQSGTLNIAGNLDGSGAASIDADAVALVGGTLSGDGNVTVGAGATLNAATLAGAESIAVAQGGSLGVGVFSGADVVTLGTDATLLAQTISGAPQISLEAGAAVTIEALAVGASPTITFGTGAELVVLPGTGAISAVLQGLTAGDLIDFSDISAIPSGGFGFGGVGVANGSLDLTGASGQSARVALSNPAGTLGFLPPVGDGSGGTLVQVACFLEGTRIATPTGEVSVQALRPGDAVLTASGRVAPVRWVGFTRLDLSRHPAPHRVAPVRIRAGAFGAGRPARDLFLSPEHCLLVGKVLIPATRLADGALVARDDGFSTVTYWHVELDRHDVLLAENCPAESFLDTGNRGLFAGEIGVRPLHPAWTGPPDKAALAAWAARGCAKLCLTGKKLLAGRAALAERAIALGWRPTADSALTLHADGAVLRARQLPGGFLARVPAGTNALRLISETFVPAEADPASGDTRRLGIAVAVARLDGEDLPTDTFAAGWHREEDRAWRWSDGDATLRLPRSAGAKMLELQFGPGAHYWRMPRVATARRTAS